MRSKSSAWSGVRRSLRPAAPVTESQGGCVHITRLDRQVRQGLYSDTELEGSALGVGLLRFRVFLRGACTVLISVPPSLILSFMLLTPCRRRQH